VGALGGARHGSSPCSASRPWRGATIGLEAREPLSGRVVRVMDGDTIAVRVDKRVLTVRYIGINTRDVRMPGR
jgi:endonuclease YncB( thermonuclease family)